MCRVAFECAECAGDQPLQHERINDGVDGYCVMKSGV